MGVILGEGEEVMINFGLIGNGTIAARHKEAIKAVGGRLQWIHDTAFMDNYVDLKTPLLLCSKALPTESMYDNVEYIVICSPTHLHREHVKMALDHGKYVICEKPLCLPWEPPIDDDRINIVLQLRWIKDLPKKADLVKAVMIRDGEFFKTWKGDPRLAGGNLYEFFIHYLDQAIQLGAEFEGIVLPKGIQERKVVYTEQRPAETKTFELFEMMAMKKEGIFTSTDWIRAGFRPSSDQLKWSIDLPERIQAVEFDIMKVDMQGCYNRMYADILKGKGVKPKDLFYLTWVLNRYSDKYGYRGGMNQLIQIGKDFL
jgi:hypothetical protein